MYTAKIQNAVGNILTLTGNEANYQILSITGLNPPSANVNTTSIAGLDGSKFNSAKLNTRNIVIKLRLNGDVEANRLLMYTYFVTKESCTFYYKNDRLDVSIKGYVEKVECNFFAKSELMQISIICPYPYFASIAEIIADISNETSVFTFPFAIDFDDPVPISLYQADKITTVINDAESQTGVIIAADFMQPVSNLKIVNVDTGEYLKLSYGFQAGDRVIINTNKGQKSVYLTRNGTTQSIFGALQSGSTFFQLAVGNNDFTYEADSRENYVFIIFRFHNLYRGV